MKCLLKYKALPGCWLDERCSGKEAAAVLLRLVAGVRHGLTVLRVPAHNSPHQPLGFARSVADPDPVGSEPFWSDPDPIKWQDPVPDPIIKSHETRMKSNKLNSYFFKFTYL